MRKYWLDWPGSSREVGAGSRRESGWLCPVLLLSLVRWSYGVGSSKVQVLSHLDTVWLEWWGCSAWWTWCWERIGGEEVETMSVLEFCCKRIAEKWDSGWTQVVGFREILFLLFKIKEFASFFYANGHESERKIMMGEWENCWSIWCSLVFPGGSDGKDSTCSAGDLGLIPGSGQSPGAGHGNPLQYSCLENSMDRGAWWATVHGVTKSQTWLIMFLSSKRDWNQELK